MRSRPALVLLLSAVALIVVLSIPVGGEAVGSRFLAALRIAKPKTVTVAGPGAGRQLPNVIAGILAETTAVAHDDSDRVTPTLDSASRVAGFHGELVRARTDAPTVENLGAHSVTVHVNRDQLQTLFVEAGRPAGVADSLKGTAVTISRNRGIRLRYGRCPLPPAATIQNQIQGSPPPSSDNGNCVILTQSPLATVAVPPGLDTGSVMEIALELGGMSPNQARDLRSLFDWRSALAISTPRGIRSYEIVSIGDTKGMLMISANRRDPAYTLAWVRAGTVFTLAGYGSSADAVPLALSVH